MTTRLMLTNVRLAFPALFEAKKVQGEGEPSFSALFLIEPDDPQVKVIQAALRAMAIERWEKKGDDQLKALVAGDRTCLHNGDAKSQYAGFEGMLYVSSRSKTRPLVIAADKSPLQPQDGKPYAGCYVNASLELWAQDNAFGKRINAGLRAVQFYRDGDAFGGGSPASVDEFEDVSAGADAGDLI